MQLFNKKEYIFVVSNNKQEYIRGCIKGAFLRKVSYETKMMELFKVFPQSIKALKKKVRHTIRSLKKTDVVMNNVDVKLSKDLTLTITDNTEVK